VGSTTQSHYAMCSGSLHADVWDHLRRVRLPGWRAPRGAPTELVYRRVSQTNPADSARTTPIWTPHLAAIYVTARTQLLPSANSTNHHLRPGLGETESAIGCLYPDAQARVALADLIRHFSAYEWMQSNGYKMAYFASAHAACVSFVQATK
jgi:hypothetical protein